ncbi:hypothetical protein [Streptomyces sp. NPDC060322]|uniref:hypothetical protein n=1 Tax=Streptomyces sp. NPDC060322 TaxID=3347097 RepID=UPI003647F0E1
MTAAAVRAAAARAAQVARAITAELDLIDNATTDPAISTAVAQIRTILADGPPPVPCPATEPHDDGGTYTCSLSTPDHIMHLDEQRSVWWMPDDTATEEPTR